MPVSAAHAAATGIMRKYVSSRQPRHGRERLGEPGRERHADDHARVRADRVERDVAQVEQARVADDDVQTEREHDVEADDREDTDEEELPEALEDDRHEEYECAEPEVEHLLAPAHLARGDVRVDVHFGSAHGLHLLHDGFAEQTARPEDKNEDQDREGDDVLVASRQEARAKRLDDS